MTPHLLSRSWSVTSVIRDPAQKAAILSAGKDGPGKIDVLIASLEDVKSQADAQKVLDDAKPDYVVWSAGMHTARSHLIFTSHPRRPRSSMLHSE